MEKNNVRREELVKKYFIKTPEKPKYLGNQVLMGLGAILLVYGLTNRGVGGFITDIAGLALLLKGFLNFSKKKSRYEEKFAAAEPKASDQQMDQWLKEYRDNIVKEARARLDIDEEDTSANPWMIDGPAKDTKWGKGIDKVLRFGQHDILLFFLTQHHVATFQCILDLATGLTLLDQTKEFPYKDITNLEIATQNNEVTYIYGKKVDVYGKQTFSLFTSGANRISVNYFFEKSTDSSRDYILPPSDADNTIRAVRKRLKEYKDRFGASGN
ncbi:MAG TPA: hypothetical protein VE035_03925 [Puia sp.]|nr:hypothetical protein [Puia sp.]